MVILLPIVQSYGLGGLLISGFMAGIILVAMGMARLGRLIEVVPYPVIIGFTSGIGVVIATLQIKDFLGLDIDSFHGHYIQVVTLILHALPTIKWQEALIGILTLGTSILWLRTRSKIPGHLVALLVGTFSALLLNRMLPEIDVATIGSRFFYEVQGTTGYGIPPVLPHFDWPWNLQNAEGMPIGISFELIHALLPSAITIAMLGALESLLCAVVADGMSGKKHAPNDELIGQGIGNIVVPLFGGIPATAAIARTAANVRSGGSFPLASVVHSVFILVSILSLAPVLAYIPMSSMAALLIIVAWNMSESKHFIRIIRIAPRDDIIVLLMCFSLTVLFDMTIAVAVGMGLAAILFIRKSIKLTSTSRVEQDHHDYDIPDSVAVYDINGSLFFGTAQKAINTISSTSPDIRVVILDMTEVNMMDISAIIAMGSILEELSKNDAALIINNLAPRMIVKLRRAGITKQDGKVEFSQSLPDAFSMAKSMA